MDIINVSHKQILQGTIHSSSGSLNEIAGVENLLKEEGYWSTQKRDSQMAEYFVIDYGETVSIDYLEMKPSPNKEQTFPSSFRFEISPDGKNWKIIHREKSFTLDSDTYFLELPLTQLRYLRVVISDTGIHYSSFFSEIGSCEVGITGISEITASSELSSEKNVKNLLSSGETLVWESAKEKSSGKETISVNLGRVYHISRIVLSSAKQGFPQNFTIESSPDNDVWNPLIDERNFTSSPLNRYYWDVDITPAQHIRIEAKTVENESGSFNLQFAEYAIFAAPYIQDHTHNIGKLTPYASVFQAGIVKLAKDGDDIQGSVVQGSDRRLRDATTIFKGIVQLAEHGDDLEGVAVQSSDPRIKKATELNHGIVRLAYDRETEDGAVVQGSDSRLLEATEESFGIVKLCPDGIDTEFGVVRGSDSRLQLASVESAGICRLAENGENTRGAVLQADDRRLRDATEIGKGIVELAEDGEDKEGVVVQGNDKRLKDATTSSKGIVELAEDGEDAESVVVQGNDKRLKEATTSSKGIVELAEDGEDRAGVAVQGSDSRIKNATTSSRGIVELAEDGEDKAGVAVQGSDSRLKDATESVKGILRFSSDGEVEAFTAVQANDARLRDATTTYKGIVELGEDGEDSEGVAIQGNDKRLKDATTSSKGIVELGEDGEDRAGVVVQGNDSRLRDATEDDKGILRFASDGEVSAHAALQSNDKRLRDGSTTYKGIVELAEDGEEKEGVVVQGNDKRLKDATTTAKGIVELAEDGEEKEGVAVQGNDRRLKKATVENDGLVRLAKNKEQKNGCAVQADDERLYDAREPLKHNHDYASLDHDFNSHKGKLSISMESNEKFIDITSPPDSAAVIYGKNTSSHDGAIGLAGIAGTESEEIVSSYGVLGHSKCIGVRGQSTGDSNGAGCGVLGISRFSAGGVFASEHDFSLLVEGYGHLQRIDSTINLTGNGQALRVNGYSQFNGRIDVENQAESNEFPANICEYFEVDDKEYISPGDIVTVSEEGNSVLSKSKSEYMRSVVGVISGNPTIVLDNSGVENKKYPVAMMGKVMCKVDARDGGIKPGDLIVTSNTPGCGRTAKIDSFGKVGTVIGKALDGLDDGIGIIPMFITHQ